MTTEQHIREAYEKAISTSEHAMRYPTFRAGYLALLNALEPSYLFCGNGMLYHLPKGVTKC